MPHRRYTRPIWLFWGALTFAFVIGALVYAMRRDSDARTALNEVRQTLSSVQRLAVDNCRYLKTARAENRRELAVTKTVGHALSAFLAAAEVTRLQTARTETGQAAAIDRAAAMKYRMVRLDLAKKLTSAQPLPPKDCPG